MIRINEFADIDEGAYLAGHLAPSGVYEEIETHRKVHLEQEGYLPARLDGNIACYVRVESLPITVVARKFESKSRPD